VQTCDLEGALFVTKQIITPEEGPSTFEMKHERRKFH